ncbi:MAG TPA: tRNA (guanosine(37)-N1)-methyltransferase TrmD [Clostridiaceae bacterium]|nr:tRNA (guanosine(37)-N1)-methyltransferase TrmD [Clostridiaceae bacterium]
MRFDVLTIFPEMFAPILGESIIGRAQQKGIIEINTIDIRDFTKNKHRKVDDYPYGGGSGLVMMAQPIYDAYMSILNSVDTKPWVIYMSPQGNTFNQKAAERLKMHNHIVILCGHYEGVDERVLEEIVDEEISIGDFVVTGGEVPAMLLIDCVSRLIPGVLSGESSYVNESHYNGILEYPQYTRPYEFNGRKVPEILLSGHHANIEKWRYQQSLKRTYEKRPDLFEKLELSDSDKALLEEALREESK